jgi:ATP-dependent DNA helicase RecG
MRLDTPLAKALGAKNGKALEAKLGLVTTGDLLRHYPRRYAERGKMTPLKELAVGEHVTVWARVLRSGFRKTQSGKWLTEVVVTDGTGTLTLAFFAKNQSMATWRAEQTREGQEGLFAGTVNTFRDTLQLLHPEVFLGEDDGRFAEGLVPVYPAAASLASWNIAKAVHTVLGTAELGADPLPPEVRDRHQLLPLPDALRQIHRPASYAEVERAQQRLRWDEAFVLQVTLAQRRAQLQAQGGTPRPGRAGGLLEAFDAVLPFTLTAGQAEVGAVLEAELAAPHPMHRLLQGEVGSGKTLVALRAMLRVVDSGGQAALLAPTEVLAQQHARSLRALLGPLATAGELGSPEVATRVALLTGSLGAAGRRAALAEAASGEGGIVVGTHALLSEGVDCHDLGLVVVDEQHRFGVEQRDALRAKGAAPHVLVMTATPIPRTVAMTVYGDLEVSTLTELPAGRSPIQTHVVPAGGKAFDRVWERIREEVAAGRQAFVVCPRIGGEDKDEENDEPGRRPAAAVAEVAPALAGGPLAGLRVEALHGRLAPEVKEEVMGRFAAGQVDVLVATTVIEVGVDVPNATVMVVLDPDRFGISQLHQLRGRVGRGGHAGLCLLVTEVDALSPAGERLKAVASTTDGFVLSRVDLEQRREGDVLGAAQSGSRSSLRMLQLLRDEELILEARQEAVAVVQADPALARHPALQEAVSQILDAERAEYLEKA